MPILYMLKVSVYAGFMQIFSGTYCGLSFNIIVLKRVFIFPIYFLDDYRNVNIFLKILRNKIIRISVYYYAI
jgi:hypothetical protein